jgi:hypothetical protein
MEKSEIYYINEANCEKKNKKTHTKKIRERLSIFMIYQATARTATLVNLCNT